MARGAQSLIVLTGYKDSESIKNFIQRAGLEKKYKVKIVPFMEQQNKYTKSFIDLVLKETFNSVISLKSNTDYFASPAAVTLIYEPHESYGILVSKFSKLAHIVKSTRQDLFSLLQNHNRHLTVENISRNSHLSLPLKNFMYTKERILGDENLVRNNFPQISQERLPNSPKRAFKDSRGYFFEVANEEHGFNHNVTCDSVKEMQHKLEGMYRFGAPIQDGHHYHVIKNTNKSCSFISYPSEEEICYDKNIKYLNITSNDYIRAKKY